MLTEARSRTFTNGKVYAPMTDDGFPVEVTDTFLPFYTKDAAIQRTNKLKTCDIGDRTERWMIGVSCMSGCPVRCKFCATGKLKKWRKLTADEIVDQVKFIIDKNPDSDFGATKEHLVDFEGVNLNKMPNTINSKQYRLGDACKCNNYLTLDANGDVSHSYARYAMKAAECVGMLVYDQNVLKVGFNGPIFRDYNS
jgi:hypothetical protein